MALGSDFMLSVTFKPCMLSVIMLSVAMLSVAMLSVAMLSVVMLNIVATRKYSLEECGQLK